MDVPALLKSVKVWFCVALLLKIICACISLKFNDPTWFGFWVPISVMGMYWVVGHRVRELYDVKLTVAKYADSVYYLGFLFTVSSIIICLFDIQSIGENLSGMAMRFGAAMVSTGLGMVARTLYVGFKQDQDDAVKGVEERAIIASENLTLMFDDTYQKLMVFRDEVVGTTKETLAGAQEQISELSKHSMGAMDTYFANATERSNEAFDAMLKDARAASDDLLMTIKGLSEKSEQTLQRMEDHAMTFGKKAEDRLEQTLFPDDLFAHKLKPSIDALAETTEGVNTGISALADDVKTAARSVGTAIRGLNTKTQILEDTLTAVGSIVESQQRLMDAMNGQSNNLLEGIESVQKEFLDTLEGYQKDFQIELKSNRAVIKQVVEKLHDIQEKIEGDDSVAAISQEINEAFNIVSEASIRANEAFSNSIKGTLIPLIEVISQSNATHRTLADRVEQGNRTIEVAHAQLDELAGKIDHISKIELCQSAVNEPIITPVLEISETSLPDQTVFDARPA
jgi:uncharacterized coiled-coil protein SlyX